MGLPNPFKAANDAAEFLEKLREVLKLAEKLKKADEDGDGIEDWKEAVEIGGRLIAKAGVIKEKVESIQGDIADVQKDVDELGELLGKDIELVRQTLGIQNARIVESIKPEAK